MPGEEVLTPGEEVLTPGEEVLTPGGGGGGGGGINACQTMEEAIDPVCHIWSSTSTLLFFFFFLGGGGGSTCMLLSSPPFVMVYSRTLVYPGTYYIILLHRVVNTYKIHIIIIITSISRSILIIFIK